MKLPPSPPTIAVPAVETFLCCRHGFRFGFCRTSEGGTSSAEAPAATTSVARHALSSSRTSQGATSTAITDPAASTRSPHGDPAPPTAWPLLGRFSNRTRRRTAATAGAESPAVDYGFGPGRPPCPSARRANTPPLAVATTPTPAASSDPTVLIPSGRDHPEPVGTPTLRVSPSP